MASVSIRPRLIISAEQWLGQEIEGCEVVGGYDGYPFILRFQYGATYWTAGMGDWVVTGHGGARFVCKADAFHERYEVVRG